MPFFKRLKWNSIFKCSDDVHVWYQLKAYLCAKTKVNQQTYKNMLLQTQCIFSLRAASLFQIFMQNKTIRHEFYMIQKNWSNNVNRLTLKTKNQITVLDLETPRITWNSVPYFSICLSIFLSIWLPVCSSVLVFFLQNWLVSFCIFYIKLEGYEC